MSDRFSRDYFASTLLQKHRALLIYFALLTIQGLVFLIYLLRLPSDPENRIFLGLSLQRWALFGGMFLVSIVSIGLLAKSWIDKNWSQRWADRLFCDFKTIPYLFLVVVLGVCSLLGWILLFQANLLLVLTPDYWARLGVPLLWGILALIELGCLWLWFWRPKLPHYSAQISDALIMTLIFLVSFGFRVVMTGYALPYQNVWDEVVTYPQALQMMTTPGLKPVSDVPGYGSASYGDLLVYLTAAGQAVGLLDGYRTQQITAVSSYVSPPQGVTSIEQAVHPSGIPLQYPRLLLALINSLAPIAIYIALRKFLKVDMGSALGGALLFGVLSREVIYYASYILPDALATTFFLFLLLFAWQYINDSSGKIGPLVACGLLAGMIVSVTIRAYLVVLLPFLAFALGRSYTRPVVKLVVMMGCVFAGFVFTSPYVVFDLPNYLAKLTAFSWYHDLSWTHRISSLAYYLQGMFQPGFHSIYVDSDEGSIGLGLLTAGLAILGIGKLIVRFPRYAIWMFVFAILQLYSITPIVQRFTRHALMLYPMACIAAGMGLRVLVDGFVYGAGWLAVKPERFGSRLVQGKPWQRIAPVAMLIIFSLFYFDQFYLTIRYVQRTSQFKVTQVQAADYLSQNQQSGNKVGILEILPWVEEDLQQRPFAFERVGLHDSIESLRNRGITYLVATDRVGGDYQSVLVGTIWERQFSAPGIKLVEFGAAALEYDGYPVGNLYLFVARLPEK